MVPKLINKMTIMRAKHKRVWIRVILLAGKTEDRSFMVFSPKNVFAFSKEKAHHGYYSTKRKFVKGDLPMPTHRVFVQCEQESGRIFGEYSRKKRLHFLSLYVTIYYKFVNGTLWHHF